MNVPIEWLRELVEIDVDDEELARQLTMAGLEVEEIVHGPHGATLSIYVTPNRPDCLSVLGVARDVAALYDVPLKPIDSSVEESEEEASSAISIEILDPDLCPRYCGRVMRGVKIGPSPQWMQSRLAAAGIRPINNVVDCTNYVLLELGHPPHAFDLRKIGGGKIIVRRARAGEVIVSIDQVERQLAPDMLVIADQNVPVAVAGVMGGYASEVSDSTTDLLLEFAYFHPPSIRRTSKALGMATEASFRFERRVDYVNTPRAADRAAQLIQQTAGGEILRGIVDADYTQPWSRQIALRPARIDGLLGMHVPEERAVHILRNLGMEVTESGPGSFLVSVPSFRADIEREPDLIEEVARIVGYDQVPIALPGCISGVGRKTFDVMLDRAKEVLCGRGLTEVVTHSLTSSAKAFAGIPAWEGELVALANPVSAEYSHLRNSLIPGLIEVLRENISHGTHDVQVFEAGRVGIRQGASVQERKRLAALFCGALYESNWDGTAREVGFYDAKGVLADLLQWAGLEPPELLSQDRPLFAPGRSARIRAKGRDLGVLGEVRSEVAKELRARSPIYLFEIDFDDVVALAPRDRQIAAPSRFPPVLRDLCVVVDEPVSHQEVEGMIRSVGGEIVESVALFDLYRGGQAGAGKKSMAYTIRFRSPEETLTDEGVDLVVEQIRRALADKLSASFRA
jgi:phenylalanyl-tRNA synthetase beta chain